MRQPAGSALGATDRALRFPMIPQENEKKISFEQTGCIAGSTIARNNEEEPTFSSVFRFGGPLMAVTMR